MWTKLKMFTASLAGVSVGLMVTGIPKLREAGGCLFAAATILSIYVIYKDAKAKGKEMVF